MLKKIKDLMANKDKNPQESDPLENMEDTSQGETQVAENEEVTKKSKSKSSSKTSKLTKELEESKLEATELKDKYLRLLAEFENFKKRTFKEKIETMKSAAQDTMTAILPVLDDFDRAKKNAEDENSNEPFSEGVNLVYQKLHNILKQKGLESMESDGEDFDPEIHEAITEIPAPTPEMKGKIVDTVEKGYLLKDKIIRHAKVVVGK